MVDSLVQELRRRQGSESLTDTSMARKLGVAKSYWSKLSNGKQSPGRKLIVGAIRVYPDIASFVAPEFAIGYQASSIDDGPTAGQALIRAAS